MADTGRQLTGWDAATWRTAAGDPHLRSTVVALVLLDSVPDWSRLRARVERLTRMVPVLRQRAIRGVFGVSSPRLAPDPDFDLDLHLRRMRLAGDGSWSELMGEARRVSLTDFDHNRALWELVLIEGLEGDRAALLLKLHHAIADGQATVLIGLNLVEMGADQQPDEDAGPEAPSAADIGAPQVSVADIVDNMRRSIGAAERVGEAMFALARGTLTDPVGTWGSLLGTAASVGRFTAMPDGPLSPVMTQRGTTYHFGAFDMPFAALRSAAKSRDRSVNDAFMAAVGLGLERYHVRRGTVVDDLRFNVPISLRGDAGDTSARAANAVTIARFVLPVAGLTVDERMDAAQEAVARWRDEPALRLADPLAEISWVVPVPVLAQAALASDVTTSNVPGPPIPLYVAGASVAGIYPLVATIGAAVNVTMVTYDGSAFVGVSSDDRAVPDIDDLVADLRSGFATVLGQPVGPADPLSEPGSGDGTPKARAIREDTASEQ
jgi:diacylglycerol O-acyltransferase / wax synthase